MRKKITLLIFICLSITGCSYEFSPDNFIKISKPEIVDNIINLNNFKNLDTINVPSQLVYTFNGEANQYLLESKLYIDNQNFGMGMNGNVGTFNIIPSTYEDGIHTIRIENKFTSGTGSLADQAQKEILTATQEFKFIVHRKPSIPPAITEAKIVDGSILVKWASVNNPEYINSYLSLKFKTKEIRIPLTKEILELGTYTDKNTILFLYPVDINNPGYDEYASVNYSIVFDSPYTELYGLKKTISCDSSWFTMKISYYNNDSFKVKWSSNPLYANFNSFAMNVATDTFLGSSKGGEYTINTPYIIGHDYEGGAIPLDPSQNYSFPIYSFYKMKLDENTFGLFDLNKLYSQDISYNPSTNTYYALIIEKSSQGIYQIYFYEYSSKMIFIKKTYIVDTFKPNSQTFQMIWDPINNNIYIDGAGSTYVIEKTNLDIVKKYSDQSSMLTYRNGILKSWNNSNNHLNITNTVTNTTIYSGTGVYRSYLSRDGKYVYIGTATNHSIYKIINNQLNKIMDVTISSYNNSGFIEIENDTVFYTLNNQIFIVDFTTKASKSFTFGTLDPYLQFDPISQKLLLTQNGYNGIYDLATKKLSLFTSETYKQATGEFSQEDRDYFLRLRNGRLIHSKGISIDIN
jgi:hypothetical protein